MAGWEDAPLLAAAGPAPGSWESAPIVQPRSTRSAAGILDAIQAGYQGSATGLAIRGQLPDVVLDAHHSKWYEKASAGFAQVVSELPEMAVGAYVGGTAGAAGGAAAGSRVPVIGTAAGAFWGGLTGSGAGAFAVPAAIRSSLIEAYKSGTVDSSGGFLASSRIVIQQTLKEAAVGALTMGAGGVAARATGSAIAPMIGTSLSTEAAARVIGTAGTAAEIGTMVVAPAAMEGRLPEWEEFLNAAIVVGGLKASVKVANKIGDIYAKTGIAPEEVVAMAKQDPTIALDLKPVEKAADGITAYHGSRHVFDKFDSAKIGEGEGAQAFGFGLYLAENPGVASTYKKAGANGDNVIGGVVVKNMQLSPSESQANNMFSNRLAAGLSVAEAREQTINWLKNGSQWRSDKPALDQAIAFAEKVEPPLQGNVYRVQITAPKERFIDWDKSVSEQTPEVQTALRSPEVLARINESRRELGMDPWTELPSVTVGNLLEQIGAAEGGPRAKQVSEMLSQLGVAGIKYLDQGSRKAGDGSRNYVVFDHNSLRVIERNGSEIPRAFQAEALQESARNAILLPEQARAFVEKPFAEVPQAPGAPKVKLNVNYDYINTPAEGKAALARATELYGEQIVQQTRGKVSWEQTEVDAARSLAEMTGAKDFSLLMPREPGTASSAVDLLLRRQILEGAVDDFTARARSYDAAKSTPEQAVQMMAAAERVAMLSAQFQGAASEAGRALNILKDARQSARSAEEVTRLLKEYDRDPATIARIMQEVDNPVAAARVAREMTKATPWEKVAEGLKAAMLSGPITWGANIVGNATFLPLRPVIDAVAAPLGVARQVLSGTKTDRTRAVEPIARIMGNWQGAVDALMAAGSFMRMYGTRPMEGLRQLDQMGARKAEVDKRAIEGNLGVIARTPFLALSIPDRFFRMMIERGEANTVAARQAAAEGHSPYSREFRERMADVRQNLTPEQIKQVEAMGDRGTFNADLGPLGKSVQDVIRKLGPLGFIVAPFVRTPLNLMKETLRLTPASPIIDTWRADIKAGGARADKALAEVVVGGTLASIVIGMAMSGKISGAGDTDPDKSRVKLAAGEQPYSFQAADGKWYEYSRLQPLGTVMGLAADFSQIWDKFENPDERDKVVAMIGVAFKNAVTNQTMLMGLSNIIRAISEPDRYGERYIQSIAAMPVPGILSQSAQLDDPYIREIHTIMDAVKNKIPGESGRESLQPKIDVWGDPIENRDRVAGAGPVRILEESTDKVKTEAARLGVSVPKTAENIVMPGSKDRKIGKVELTPEQQTAYAVVAGKQAYAVMETIVNSKDWDAKPDIVKRRYYEEAFERARTAARRTVLTPEQRQYEAERIRAEVAKQLAPPGNAVK